MNKNQVIDVLETISNVYQNKFKMENPKKVIEAWFNVLKDYEFDFVMDNLSQYIKSNHFPPSIADLVKEPEKRDRAIPSIDETREMLRKQKESEEWVAANREQIDEVRKREMAKVAKMLGIKRGE